ncbi:MAG: SsrA-binding protein SmpB [Eubacterium aggregans]|uniref:SsrA-binding protein n=1 Tax=Eubacterium aggregans TaxID=81409 RepID=A0A1H4B5W8_9FIRM|nr:SsrA-binding protein SmpB [Eubacterium aggregans]MDD4690648.1 SsrA-binding protein SmpB [Eubacterium aggregans]MEA5073112.1 SsrA-binding protein SmpB [Eubacterium aggregans]SEA43603.1 SsrA-binding protein [Eubacterium aggregans]
MAELKKNIANNKKARHDYFIEETYECGIALYGTEVKSLRQGKVSLKESYADIRDGEVFVFQMNISPYEQGNIYNKDPLRPRKLLLHKSEIRKLIGLKQRDGYTLVPLSLYFSRGKVKLELALAKGKKLYDKRHTIAEKDAKRRMQRSIRDHY